MRKIRTIIQLRKRGRGGSGAAGRSEALTFASGGDDSSPLSAAELRHLSALLQRLSHTSKDSSGVIQNWARGVGVWEGGLEGFVFCCDHLYYGVSFSLFFLFLNRVHLCIFISLIDVALMFFPFSLFSFLINEPQ